MTNAVEEYRGHKVGTHRYASAGDDEQWAVHVNGVSAGAMLGNPDIAMKIGRDRVDQMLKTEGN